MRSNLKKEDILCNETEEEDSKSNWKKVRRMYCEVLTTRPKTPRSIWKNGGNTVRC